MLKGKVKKTYTLIHPVCSHGVQQCFLTLTLGVIFISGFDFERPLTYMMAYTALKKLCDIYVTYL